MNTLTLIKREIKLSIRNFGLILSYSSFFLLSLLIFTFGVGPDLKQLNTVYIPIIWVIMLFAVILVSDNFLLSDYQNYSQTSTRVSEREAPSRRATALAEASRAAAVRRRHLRRLPAPAAEQQEGGPADGHVLGHLHRALRRPRLPLAARGEP